MVPFKVTQHALGRALDMCLTAEQIRELMNAPEIRRWHLAHGGAWLYKRGDLAAFVVESDDVRVVKTFVPATDAGWENEALLPAAPGRDPSRWLGR